MAIAILNIAPCVVGIDMADWHPTAYRTHTLGEIQDKGADLVGTEVTVCGFMEANRGKGAICFVDHG